MSKSNSVAAGPPSAGNSKPRGVVTFSKPSGAAPSKSSGSDEGSTIDLLYPDKHKVEMLKVKIKEGFDIFYRSHATFAANSKGKTVTIIDATSVIRYLGCFPTEKQLSQELIPRMLSDEDKSLVLYEKFEEIMLKTLLAGKHKPDGDIVIRKALETLDLDKSGTFECAMLKKLLTESGPEPLTITEADQFLRTVMSLKTGKIHIDDYIELLMDDCDDIMAEKELRV